MAQNINMMSRLTSWKLLTIFVLVLSCLQGQSQTIKADSLKFPIGSKLNLTLELPYSANSAVKWPVINDTITKSIEVLSKSKIDTITDEASGRKFMRQIIGITSFDTGFLVIPPFVFTSDNQSGGQSVSTEPLLLEVFKVKVDPASDIKDIKPVMKAPITFAELVPVLAVLLIIGIIVYSILYYARKRKVKPLERTVPKVRIPAWEVALKKLEQLKNEQIWQKGDVKEYYSRLTDILREYFDMRYNVNAAEMTSSEILEVMRITLQNDTAHESLRNVLFLADMAKFAKAQPGAYENETSIAQGIEIINSTKPVLTGQENSMVNKPE